MARKPNYRFERMERDRQKAAKKAARAEAKARKAEQKKGEADGILPAGEVMAVAPPVEAPIDGSLNTPAAGAPAGPRED